MKSKQTNLHFVVIVSFLLALSSPAAGQIRLSGSGSTRKTSGSFRETQTSGTNSATFNIHKVDFDKEGSYQCQYQKRGSSQTFSSPLSDSVRLSVTVSFPKPRISMSPASEVTWGQDVRITCSISTQVLGGTFILQQTSGSFRETQTSGTNSSTFNIHKMDFDKEGSYQCQYQKRGSSQTFSSPLSDSVRISVTVSLQQPNILLTCPDGGLVLSPQGAEVTRVTALSSPAPFTPSILKVVSSSSSPAPPSLKPMPLLPLLSSVAAGGLLLLLLVLLVVCLVCRRRRTRQAKQPAVLIFSQMSVGADNEYEEEEDDDYVNVDQMESKEIKEEVATVENEESDDYEDPETDSEHDYEEAGPDEHYAKPKEECLRVEDYRDQEEEEDDDDDDDNDYENVDESFCEKIVDIYSEDEDIYQNV
ncbi:hypothetical protein Q5P01_016706 [Channa striata]|uniref:Ig-like domain-containing protein n=1 Tax=Channa striata TaxID=64152 RepID=A0AA88MAR7_CHASR|nr:hypothetical protein Q5P01_016706 [Channa striata]